MKKLTSYFLLFITSWSFAQDEFSSDAPVKDVSVGNFTGANVEFMGTTLFNYQPGHELTIPFVGLGFYPRYNFFAPKDWFSTSIGAPINFGIEANSTNYDSYFMMFTDVPLELAINLGDKATTDSYYWFGSYFATGLNYNYSLFNNLDGFKVNAHSFGPMVSFGFRYRYYERPMGVRFSYTWGALNNFEEDPCDCLIYENGTTPKIISLSVTYGIY